MTDWQLASLAINGGKQMRTRPFPTWPVVPPKAADAIAAVLASGKINYWTGTETREFEREYAAYLGVDRTLAVANGTVALEIALRTFGIGPGDEVIVPSRTFIATAGAVVAVGATPVVADIDPHTNCVTPLTVAEVLSPRTKAVIPVHLGGYPADVAAIKGLAAQVGAVVIEDCAQAHGATINGRPVGTIGDAGCFSFCQDKILPLGEGGLVCFADPAAHERAWALRDHGRDFKLASEARVGEPSAQFRWLTTTFGTNARMPEIVGALGRVMLRHLPAYHEARVRNAGRLAAALSALPGLTPLVPAADSGLEHGFYRLYGLIDTDRIAAGWSRDRIIDAINTEGVPAQYGSCALISNEVAFSTIDLHRAPTATLEGAELAHERSIAFFVHPGLTEGDIDDIAAATYEVLREAIVGAE